MTGSPQSGHTSSSCGSPPTAAPTDSLTAPACLANFAAAAAVGWPLIDAQGAFCNYLSICEIIDFFEGVKSEIKSPGLDDSEVAAALSAHQDVVTATAPFYGASPADIGAATYDKDYPQAYAQAHQYYNR